MWILTRCSNILPERSCLSFSINDLFRSTMCMGDMQRMCKFFVLLVAGGVFVFVIGLYAFSLQSGSEKHRPAPIDFHYERQYSLKKSTDPLYLNTSVKEGTEEQSPEKKIQQRVDKLRLECKKLQRDGFDFQKINRSSLDHLIVSDEYRVMYCYVPKVACTNLKRVFLLLTGKMNETDPLKLPSASVHSTYDKYLQYLDTFSPSGIEYRLRHYKKIIFVREPFERTLSAYRNKFVQAGNEYFKQRFGQRIIKKYRKNPSERSLKRGDDLQFSEFVQYLVDPDTANSKTGFNEHWAPFVDLCHPCHIQYDFIGRYETIDDDVDMMLKELAVEDIIHFPKRSDMYKTKKTEDFMSKFYRKLDPVALGELRRIYSQDYQMFGYDFPESLRN